MDTSNKITQNQYRSIVEGSMVALGILTLSRNVTKYAYQEAWISVIIGGIYPIIVILLATFIDKKMNGYSFEKINNNIYGKFLSKIILIAFSIEFIFYEAAIIAGFTNITKFLIVPFISHYIIIVVVFLITLYTTINGLTLIGRLSEIVFYFLIVLVGMMITLSVKGSIINVKPFFTSFNNIFSAMPNSLYSYSGVELSYIVISFITNKTNPKKAGLQAVLFIIFTYASNVFAVIYSLGWEIASKNSYPILYLASTIQVPLIENFRTILMIIWSFVVFRILGCYLFGAGYCLSKAFNMKYNISLVITLILAVVLSLFMIPEYNRVNIIDKFISYAVGFGLLWGIITSIIIVIKKKHINKI